MLVWSEYLKELGYKKSDFPFRKKDERYTLDKKLGVVEAQTWNLNTTIILELYVQLRYFQDGCTKGIPMCYVDDTKPDKGMSVWQDILQEIIDGLKAYIIADNMCPCSDEERAEQDKLYKQFDKAWALLGENLPCLWW